MKFLPPSPYEIGSALAQMSLVEFGKEGEWNGMEWNGRWGWGDEQAAIKRTKRAACEAEAKYQQQESEVWLKESVSSFAAQGATQQTHTLQNSLVVDVWSFHPPPNSHLILLLVCAFLFVGVLLVCSCNKHIRRGSCCGKSTPSQHISNKVRVRVRVRVKESKRVEESRRERERA